LLLDVNCIADCVLERALLHTQARQIPENRVREVGKVGFDHGREETVSNELNVLKGGILTKASNEKVQEDVSH
jgi:hypothetical protein